MKKVQKESAYESVLSDLRKRILFHMLDDSYNFTEENLSSEYGVSRATIRSALGILYTEGLITVSPTGRKAPVGLTAKDTDDFIMLRIMIEQEAARICINDPGVDISVIAEASSRFSLGTNMSDDEKYRNAVINNIDFHRSLFVSAGNLSLRNVWRSIEPYVFILTEQNYLQRTDRFDAVALYREHYEIFDQILNKDERVFETIREHIADLKIDTDNIIFSPLEVSRIKK